MDPKNEKKKRKNKKQRQRMKNNNEPTVMSNAAQNSTVTETVIDKPKNSSDGIKNTAKNVTLTETVIDKPKSGSDGTKNTAKNSTLTETVINKSKTGSGGTKNTAKNSTLTEAVINKPNSGSGGIIRKWTPIKTLMDNPKSGSGGIENTVKNSKLAQAVIDKPISGNTAKNATLTQTSKYRLRRLSDAQNSIATENISEKPKNDFDYTNRLGVIKKISNLLDVNNKCVIRILEKLLVLHEDGSAEKGLKLQIMDLLLTHLETSDSAELGELVKICQKSSFEQTFEKYIVHDKAIDSDGVMLGEGGFGVVNLGKLYKPDGSWVYVAVKRPIKYVKIFIEEAKLMARFNHENVIKILAFQKNPPKIAMEYMELKSLSTALRTRRFGDMDLLQALHDVASGMEHIANMNCIHRDLACKNIFVNSKMQCKVGDFGLGKYVGDTGGIYKEKKYYLNLISMAPEAKAFQEFSVMSDVWAMGLLMWEIYYIAENSENTELSAQDKIIGYIFALNLFQLTGELSRPRRCPLDIFAYIMTKILDEDPQQRPSFTAIKKIIYHELYK